MAGATTLVPCHNTEFNATALMMYARPMSAGKKAFRAGQSNPETNPNTAPMAITCHMRTASVTVSTTSTVSKAADRMDVAINSNRRLTRSATTPPNRLTAMVGNAVAAPR